MPNFSFKTTKVDCVFAVKLQGYAQVQGLTQPDITLQGAQA
jgi:hypothetical protein